MREEASQRRSSGLWRTTTQSKARLARFFGVACALAANPAWSAIPEWGYRVIHAYPHDKSAFTEGLFFLNGVLYESTGLERHSTIRKVNLQTGAVLQEVELAPDYFGEGLVNWQNRLVSLTWKSHMGFVWDLHSLKKIGEFSYPGEGWALTQDGHRLIMSDGTPELRYLDPETLKETRRVTVTYEGHPVPRINELEWVKDRIYANVWETNKIVMIDPASGAITAVVDLKGLLEPNERPVSIDGVLNGIAYDSAHDRLFVTGKNWPKLFEIRVVPSALPP